MKTILISRVGMVPVCIHLLILIALYSFAPAHPPSSVASLSTEQILNPITGTVTYTGEPTPGVKVSVKGSSTTTVTDENGFYSIPAEPDDILVFTHPDYETVEIQVGLQTIIDIELYEAIALEEAVINAGYYTVKDKERTGSISRITAEEIERQPVNNILEALQGRVPGLEIMPTTGLAGGGYTVRLRGQNSISAGNEPLYVIDGVPFETSSLSTFYTSGAVMPRATINPLNTLDPSSIESVEILKDADATAIYGSRGANGVILITTKNGKSGKTRITIDVSNSINRVTKLQKLLNTEQYLKMRNGAFINDRFDEYPANAYDINGTWDLNRYTDWQKEFIGNIGSTNSIDLSIAGGKNGTHFTLGGNFMKETSVILGDFNYKKYAFYSSLSHSSKNQKFKLSFSANYGLDSNKTPTSDPTGSVTYLPPNAPALWDEEGNLNWENSTWTNPLAAFESTYKNYSDNLTANTLLRYKPFSFISFQTNLGYTFSNLNEIQTNPHTMFDPAWGLDSSFSNMIRNTGKRNSWIIEPQLNSNMEWGNSSLNIILGATLQKSNSDRLSLLATGFFNNSFLENISAADQIDILNEQSSSYTYAALFARINYILNNRYILNLTGRRDGSSRFGPGRRFANFGAVGLGWIFSKEEFMKDWNWLSFGKLRASYGITGNDQIGDYQFLNSYSINNNGYNGYSGLYPSRLYNPDYAWENNKKLEVALEMSLFRDLLSFELNYYKNRSGNLLINLPLPGTTGFSQINANLDAVVENSGWEFNLKTNLLNTEAFHWSSNLMFSIPENKLISFDGLENSTYANSLKIGESLGIYKLYYLKGLNSETGLYEFQDFNGDGEITAIEDKQFIADLSPKFSLSWANNLRYKKLELNFLWQYVNKKNFNEFYGTQPPGFMFNQPDGILDQSTIQPYTSGNNYDAYIAFSQFKQSNEIISDASFFRLKSLSFNYTLPIPEESGTNCQLYIRANNLITLTQFKGRDPEQYPGYLPPLKRISIGIKLQF